MYTVSKSENRVFITLANRHTAAAKKIIRLAKKAGGVESFAGKFSFSRPDYGEFVTLAQKAKVA